MTSIQQISLAHQIMKGLVNKTPLEYNKRLSKKYSCDVYIKREDLQITRSFKVRGAINNITNKKSKNIVCASAGNHAQGFALACNLFKKKGTIFMPDSTPFQKQSRVSYFGKNNINIELIPGTFDNALDYATSFSNNSKNTEFVHPYDDIDTIHGQATISKEIYEHFKPDYIFAGVGGGGLISGISFHSKYTHMYSNIIGVEPEGCASMKLSIDNKRLSTVSNPDTFVDGAAVKTPGTLPYTIVSQYVDNIVTVSNGEICEEILKLYQEDGIIAEPAGVLSICGLDKIDPKDLYRKRVVCVLSGGNNDISRYPEIIEKALIHQNLRHYFIIEMTQNPGKLKKFIQHVLGKNDDIIRFEYIKKTNMQYGNILLGIQINDPSNIDVIIRNMIDYGYKFIKITENDLIYKFII